MTASKKFNAIAADEVASEAKEEVAEVEESTGEEEDSAAMDIGDVAVVDPGVVRDKSALRSRNLLF